MTKNKVAIFDIDGTIFRKNLHFELIDELVWYKVFPQEVRQKLTEVYSNWLEHEGTYEDYRRSLVQIYADYVKGVSVEDVQKAAASVVPFHKKRTYIFAEELIARLRSENYFLMAISGSPTEIVEEYNKAYLNFDLAYGSVYEVKDGKYTGEAVFEPSKDKGQVARQCLTEHKLSFAGSYAVGDTESDAKLLQLVDHPIAFNPNQNLKKLAEENGWKIVVEKKDVIYEIN